MSTVRIVVAEDEYFTRQGICRILSQADNFEIVAETDNGEQAIELVRTHQPDLLLLDIKMPPGIDGVEVIRRLRGENNNVLIIALTDEKRLVKMVKKLGANGYIPKDKYQMLVPCAQCVASSGSKIFIDPDLSESFDRIRRRVEDGGLLDLEMEVWKLIAYKNEEIARRLSKTEGRVRNLVAEIYHKLNIPKSEKVSQRILAIELARTYGVLENPSDVNSGFVHSEET